MKLYITLTIFILLDISSTEYAIRKKRAIEKNPLMKNPKVRFILSFIEPFLPAWLYFIHNINNLLWLDWLVFFLYIPRALVVVNNIFQLVSDYYLDKC